MLSVLHGFYKPILLTLLVIIGLSCGHLADAILQKILRQDFAVKAVTNEYTAIKPRKTPVADLNLILQNNIFDASNRSPSAVMGIPSTATAVANSEAFDARTEWKLLGTVVANGRSLALLETKRDVQIYHLGDELPDGGTLEAIERIQVKIRNRDQSLKTLTLHEQGPFSARGTPSNAETNRAVAGDIRAVGENRWLVSRNLVESARANFADQLRLAQMEPRAVNGKIDGFRIKRINARSLLVKMGMRRGDVVKEVNNIRLDSPEKALQIFQQLREARQIAVKVERNGQQMNFAYEIN